ncbi:hypothetical protein D3C83_65870 [compost metagenome]
MIWLAVASSLLVTCTRVELAFRRSNSMSALLPPFLARSTSFLPRNSMAEIGMPIWLSVETKAGLTRAIGASKVLVRPLPGKPGANDAQPETRLRTRLKTKIRAVLMAAL